MKRHWGVGIASDKLQTVGILPLADDVQVQPGHPGARACDSQHELFQSLYVNKRRDAQDRNLAVEFEGRTRRAKARVVYIANRFLRRQRRIVADYVPHMKI